MACAFFVYSRNQTKAFYLTPRSSLGYPVAFTASSTVIFPAAIKFSRSSSISSIRQHIRLRFPANQNCKIIFSPSIQKRTSRFHGTSLHFPIFKNVSRKTIPCIGLLSPTLIQVVCKKKNRRLGCSGLIRHHTGAASSICFIKVW